MPSTTFIDGSVLRLTLSDDAGVTFDIILHAQSGSISFTRDTSDIITKDIGGGTGWTEKFPKNKSGSLSCSGLIYYATAAGQMNVADLFTHFDAGTLLDFQWTTGVTGDRVYSGLCRCVSLSENADANTESGFDAQFDTDGTVTVGVVA